MWWLRVAAVTALASTVACARGDEQALRRFELVVPGAAPVAIELPVWLDRRGLLPDDAGRYQLRARVQLAPTLAGRELTLVLPSLPANVDAVADGEVLVARNAGPIAGYRRAPPLVWAVPALLTGDGALDLTLDVEHTWALSGWLTVPPALMPASEGLGAATWTEIVNYPLAWAGTVTMLSIGLTMLWVYLLDRTRRASLFFALQALSASLYPANVAGLLIPFGRFEGPILGTSLVVALTTGVYYTRAFFALGPPSRWWLRIAVLDVAILWLSADPFRFARIGNPINAVFLTVAMVGILITTVRQNLARRLVVGWLYFLAWACMVLMVAPDLMYWMGQPDLLAGCRTGVVAFVMFPLFLELLLHQQHLGSLGSANRELATRVDQLEAQGREIEQLNAELRRQLADRAAQIYAALELARQEGRVAPALASGEVILGRYRVERELGSGGMGTVYEVIRIADGRRLALKLSRAVHGEALARLAREAQAALTVAHPNVVAMIDMDVVAAGYVFLVMELVDGDPLSRQRARYGDRVWALPILTQLARGLAALHHAGVVHRDLKPGNVLLAAGDAGIIAKITDFGISLPPDDSGHRPVDRTPDGGGDIASAPVLETSADAGELTGVTQTASPERMLAPVGTAAIAEVETAVIDHSSEARSSRAPLTRLGVLSGTPAYIAPELAHGMRRAEPPSDVFSFGVIAHELLLGRRPFAEPAALALREGRRIAPTTSIARDWPDAPPELARALDACLDFAPEARPTADELVRLLGP